MNRFLKTLTRSSGALFLSLGIFTSVTRGAGLFGDGADARSISLGGAATAEDGSVIAALSSNPAALSISSPLKMEIGAAGVFADAKFDRADGTHARFGIDSAEFPAAGISFAGPAGMPFAVGLGFVPEVALEADWRYRDPLGGLGGGASYGLQDQRSRILGLRSNLGVSVALAKWLSLGASAGAINNENELHAPYVFQSQPVLAGFKTLLDLQTDGWGPSFAFGAQLHPAREFTLGLSYRTSSVVYGDGHASGNAAAQLQSLGGGFASVDPNFRYDAEVRTKFPQIVSAGAEWQALERLRFIGGIDWINWSDAFDRLEIRLTNGSNPAINGVVGSASMIDVVPLRWRDQFVYRAGLEYAIINGLAARAGYSYARSAVPNETLTPLNAAIFEHKVSAGLGYKIGRYHADIAWQWSLPTTERVGVSGLLDGEYSHSSVRLSEHRLALTTGMDF